MPSVAQAEKSKALIMELLGQGMEKTAVAQIAILAGIDDNLDRIAIALEAIVADRAETKAHDLAVVTAEYGAIKAQVTRAEEAYAEAKRNLIEYNSESTIIRNRQAEYALLDANDALVKFCKEHLEFITQAEAQS